MAKVLLEPWAAVVVRMGSTEGARGAETTAMEERCRFRSSTSIAVDRWPSSPTWTGSDHSMPLMGSPMRLGADVGPPNEL